MNTKTFIILSILILVIFLLYNFQIIRYIYLHNKNPEKFIEKYNNLNKADKNNKTCISFTSSPEKMKNIKPMINSILDQTSKIDSIILNIDGSDKNYKFPSFIDKVCYIAKCGKNYGNEDSQCIIPSILREDNSETNIFVLKDNYVYGKDFIQLLTEEINEKGKPIETKGAFIFKPKHFKEGIFKIQNIDNIKDLLIVKPIKYSYFENYKRI